MNESVRLPAPFRVSEFLLDHRIQDRAVLPAAHALCLMAETVEKHTCKACPLTRDAVFQGFIFLPDPPGSVDTIVEIREEEDGGFGVSLLTKITARNRSITRMKEHLRARFLPPGPIPPPPPEIFTPGHQEPGFPVDRDAIYRELVPFGPAFRNCSGPVHVAPEGVKAELNAPTEHPANPILGSPFVFDAALHAVNVWTQRYRGIVAFPVGYESRTVLDPTRAGGNYLCRALPHPPTEASSQTFDLWILDPEHRVRETVTGLRMRELFAGQLQPPEWILP